MGHLVSRRGVLRTGGMLGALGALSLGSPTTAWAWTPAQSLAGAGDGTDPHLTYDEQADPVVARLLEEGVVPEVNALLRTWRTNEQPLPAGLPGYLHEFMEQARQLPGWVDPAKLATAAAFGETRGLYLGFLYGLGSGMMSTAIPAEAQAVYYSKGGGDMKDRIAKTAKLGYDIGTPDAYTEGGEMVVTAVKTRLVHAAVRHLLPQSPHWGDRPAPITQADMLVTWHSLPTFVMARMVQWGIDIPDADADAFLHLWQLAAHMLGIRGEYIPATWADANDQYPQVMGPATGPTQEGVYLADVLLDLVDPSPGPMRRSFEALTRYLLGPEMSDWIEIPRRPAEEAMIRGGWPWFIAFREGGTHMPGSAEAYYAFDEMLRRGALWYLSEGSSYISIEIPTGNRAF